MNITISDTGLAYSFPVFSTAIVTGIGQYGYTGSQEVSFTIELKKPEMNNISIKSFPTKTTYKEGETLDPTGLVLTTSYDNGTTADVVYSEETAKDFAFNPDTKTALSKGNTKVTVTYGGFETEFAITVTEAKKPDPEKPDPEKPFLFFLSIRNFFKISSLKGLSHNTLQIDYLTSFLLRRKF